MQNLFSSFCKYLFLIITISLIFNSCSDDNPVTPEKHNRAEIAQASKIGVTSVEEINNIFTEANFNVPFTLKYSVEVYSVNYYSINSKGEKVLVSGAIMVPQGISSFPLLSLQHGTQSKRDLVASVSSYNSVEGTIGLLTASLGYFTIIPDYLGFGVSNVMHPYLHAESLVPSVIDFMIAAKAYCLENQFSLDGRVFLTGYSEGGYVSLITQKAIEENYSAEFNLTAVAPLSGPYNLSGMVDSIFVSESYTSPAYIAYFLTAYNNIYGWNRLSDFFISPYDDLMPSLFHGDNSWGEIVNQLPSTFSELVKPSFVSSVLNKSEREFITAVQENTLLVWTPKTPIHFFHGDADKIVPYQNVLSAIEAFNTNGATNIQLTTIPGGTHETSGPIESIGAIQWFERFKVY